MRLSETGAVRHWWHVTAILVLLACVTGGPALAQDEPPEGWGPGLFMGQAVRTVFEGIGIMTEDSNLGLIRGVSFFATFLPANGSVQLTASLEEGQAYCLIGGGDEDCVDLDISVFGPDGEPVASDTLEDPRPVVDFTAPTEGAYTVKLELFNPEVPSFCAMAILGTGAWTCPTESMEQALVKFLATAEAMNEQTGALSFHDESNQWCLYGGVMESGGSLLMSTITLEEGAHVFLASADDDIQDLDLYLLDGEGGYLAADELEDAAPILTYQGERRSDYQLQAANVGSLEPTFIMFGILDQHTEGDQGAEG